MQDDLESKVDQYLDLADKTTSVRPELTSAATPLFPENQLHKRASIPFKHGKAAICPARRHAFAKDDQMTPEEYGSANIHSKPRRIQKTAPEGS